MEASRKASTEGVSQAPQVLLRLSSPQQGRGGRNATKQALKEKFVDVYEAFFQGRDPSSEEGDAFWDALFLLKVNIPFLERCIILTSEAQLVALQDSLHTIVFNCIRTLERAPSALAMHHALETLSVLLRGIFRKKFENFGFDIVNLMGGFARGEALFKKLVLCCVELMSQKRPLVLREAASNLLTIIVTATDNVNQNALLEYVFHDSVFDALLQLFRQLLTEAPSAVVGAGGAADKNGAREEERMQRQLEIAFRALFVTVVLVNYKKYEAPNLFLKRLREVVDASVLRAFSSVICHVLFECNDAYAVATRETQQQQQGVLRKVSGWFGSLVWSGPRVPAQVVSASPSRTGAVLLALYELLHSNPNFFIRSFLEAYGVQLDDATAAESQQQAAVLHVAPKSANVMRQFLVQCSYVFLDIRDTRSVLYAKLCFVSLSILAEDDAALDLLHDAKFAFEPPIELNHKSKTRAIVQQLDDSNNGKALPLPPIAHLLECLLEFLKNNVHNSLEATLHLACLNVVHKILCYQKQNHVRLKFFRWEQLWTQLFRLMGFLSKDEWMKEAVVLELCEKITTIFNLFITYGDTFLPHGSDYDHLYYELIRETRTITFFSEMVEKYAADSVVAHHLENIKAIIAHFKRKLNQWTADNDGIVIDPDTVVSVIKQNYETLKLTLLDKLDVYDAYLENPKEVNFFRQVTRTIVYHYKTTVAILPIEEKLKKNKKEGV